MYCAPDFRTKIIQDFWPNSHQARLRFEDFVGRPSSHSFSGPHQCWDYWYLPNVYCYLRTDAVKVLGRELVDDFMQHLHKLCVAELHGAVAGTPWMSLHLNGMRHEIHNDACNGTAAYIYSLTKDPSKFTGGETCVVKAGVFDDLGRHNSAWHGFFEVISPRFNQLILFDDRLAHMVPVVQGTMNPVDGRVCLTGHIRLEPPSPPPPAERPAPEIDWQSLRNMKRGVNQTA